MQYSDIRKQIIREIIKISYLSKEGHVGSSLSILDILYVLYSTMDDKDKLVLSKGHASLGLYAILDHFNLLHDNIENFCKFNSKLGGHPHAFTDSEIECSTGSLGHGLPFALGLAMAKKIKNESGRIFCIIGDGEANEGTVWESALLAKHHKLDNLICFLDHNRSTNRALDIDSIVEKFEAFGWNSIEIDGHNTNEILNMIKYNGQNPFMVLCHTIKGKGIKRMENNPEWHHKSPNTQEYEEIILELTNDS